MGLKRLIRNNHAFTEVLDTVLLLGVAIASFGVIAMTVLPFPIPATHPNVTLSAYIRGDYVFIEHMGGESLQFKNISISVYIGDTPQSKPSLHEINSNGLWELGEFVRYFYNTTDLVSVLVVDTVSNTVLLEGNLRRGETPWIGAPPPILVSSLRTNTVDEDLICYAPSIQGFDAHTFIYNWKKGGAPIAEVLLPFDTQSSSTAKDYSGNGYDGTVNGATWISSGKVGGAYSFDGVDDSIVTPLPTIFNDWHNDFTISFWLYSKNIESDTSAKCIVEAYIDSDNSFQIFQYNSSIQFDFKMNGELKKSIRTTNLSENTWYYIALTWTYDIPIIYVNGSACPHLPGMLRDYGVGNITSLTIGQRSDGNDSFYGYIDDFVIYRSTLSPEQIYQIYVDTKEGLSEHRTIVSEETQLGEMWSCTITPNNAQRDSDAIDSEILTIVSYPGGG